MRNGRRGEVDLADVVGHELGADVGGLLLHLLHEPRALDDVGKAGVIFDIRGGGQLTAGFDALDQDRIEHGAGGVNRRRIASRPGANDDEFGVGGFAQRLTRQLRVTRKSGSRT